MLHSEVGGEGVVGVDPGQDGIKLRFPNTDLRKVMLQQQPFHPGRDKGAADNDPVRHPAEDGFFQSGLRLFPARVQVQQGQPVTLPAQFVADTADDIKHMRVFIGQALVKPVCVQHILTGASGQVGRRGVRGIMELLHHLQHFLPGFGGHMGLVVDHLADRGDGHARFPGDIMDGSCHSTPPFLVKRFRHLLR